MRLTRAAALRSFIVGAAAVTTLGATPASSPKPFRTLVYDVAMTLRTIEEDQPSVSSPSRYHTPNRAPPAVTERASEINDDGTLTVVVIAATRDGGLVIDAAYAGKTTAQPAMRIGITADGLLLHDPKLPLSAAAHRVLPYLARGFIAERDVSPGSAWTVNAPPPASGSSTYTVRSALGSRATIALETSFEVPGTTGYSEIARGTVVYATDRLCPERLEFESNAQRSETMEHVTRVRTTLIANLRSDSFVKTP